MVIPVGAQALLTDLCYGASPLKEVTLNPVVHFEISVPDPELAVTFYSTVFSWTIRKLSDPVRYWQVRASEEEGAIPGGIVGSKTGVPRVAVTIQVQSVRATCDKIKEHGGSIVTQPQVVEGYGTHVLCKDPQGVFFAILEPPSRE